MDKDKDKNKEQDSQTSVGFPEKKQEVLSFFSKNPDFVFMFKKTEKLVTAVYLVTNLFDNSEPMKWSLRNLANDILSQTLDYKDVVVGNKTDFTDSLSAKILQIVSMLQIASRSGLVSVMNFSILEQEFAGVVKYLEEQKKSGKENPSQTLSTSFFFVQKPVESSQNPITKNSEEVQNDFNEIPSKSQGIPIKDTNSVSDKSGIKKTNRQSLILSLLKKKSDLSIKDIALIIQGCSEKTVQRELISLIDAGLVKRTGERRWSKYSLIK
jgi:hypothetical protein